MQHCEQRATYILDPRFPSLTPVVAPQRAVVEQRVNLCHLDNMSPSGVCLVD